MRALFFKLFEQSHFDTGITITILSVPHLVYLLLIFGTITLLYQRFQCRSQSDKERLLGLLVYAIMASYLSDFFVQEFVYPDGLNTEKLPFHICIVTAVLMPFAQFQGRCKWLREPVAVMAVLSPLMYLCFPASVGQAEPWCYQAVQTMFFHGTQLAWGLLMLLFDLVRLEWKHIWKPGVLLVAMTLWAKFGNLLYERNYFFLEEDALFIGLVANGVIPKWMLMLVNPAVFFLAVLVLYGVCDRLQARVRKADCKVVCA